MFRLITFYEIPRILFAHTYQTARYAMQFSAIPHLLEISMFQQGAVDITKNGEITPVSAPGLFINYYDAPLSVFSSAPVHRHATVCLAGNFKTEPLNAAQAVRAITSPYDACSAILPDQPQNSITYIHLEKRLNQLILQHSLPGNAAKLQSTAHLFSLLAELTDASLQTALHASAELSPMAIKYVQNAEEYIAQKINEKITLGQVAQHLKISVGYLCKLFKDVKNQTVVDYINQRKLESIREIMLSKKATLAEAGRALGITDENYLSRLFKKHTGMGARSFKKSGEKL